MSRRPLLSVLFIYFVLLVSIDASGDFQSSLDEFLKALNEFVASMKRKWKSIISGGRSNGTDVEEQLLTLTNEARSSGRFCGGAYYPAVPSLVWNSALGQASNSYARKMSNTNIFRHDPNMGGLCISEGENIAHGYQTPESVFDGWLRSPSHCANLMSPQYHSFGGGQAGTYWVQKFGSGCS
jgi:uncharacterized protein YkwD